MPHSPKVEWDVFRTERKPFLQNLTSNIAFGADYLNVGKGVQNFLQVIKFHITISLSGKLSICKYI